ncbi:uncharacterized protein ACNLHF_024503 isoform 4-T7 [Anomaloglossus baeobatrachus]
MERSSRMWSGLEKLLPPSTLLTFGINMSFGKESVKAHIYENSSLLHPWLSFVNLKAWSRRIVYSSATQVSINAC